MALADLQAAIARLATSAELLARFRESPHAVAADLWLPEADRPAFISISASEITRFADSLVAKRRGDVVKQLPITLQLLGIRTRSVFARYAIEPVPSGPRRYPLDAIRFARFVARQPETKNWRREVILYEADRLDCATGGTLIPLRFYSIDVIKTANALLRGEDVAEPPRNPRAILHKRK